MTDASALLLLQQILSGESAELKRLAAEGMVPLPLEELLPVQISLTEDTDAEVSAIAREALADSDPKVVAPFLMEGRPTEGVLEYFARHGRHPQILEAVVNHRRTPSRALAQVAARLPADLQERLLLRQDAIVESPEILDALESNERLSRFAERRIREIRRHLLFGSVVGPMPEGERGAAVLDDEGEETERVASIREAFKAAEQSADENEVSRRQAAQIRRLPVAERIALCKAGPRALRMILIRDQHPVVAASVMRFNRLTDDEAEQVAKSRTVIDDILEAIARDRTWVRRIGVVEALVRNPKTPTAIAIKLLPRLAVRSLREIQRDRNVPEALRSRAYQLYTIKSR
ncbi:MAG: hypothetical protein R2991_05710 [Thermoanaerobaculia bacterium]